MSHERIVLFLLKRNNECENGKYFQTDCRALFLFSIGKREDYAKMEQIDICSLN